MMRKSLAAVATMAFFGPRRRLMPLKYRHSLLFFVLTADQAVWMSIGLSQLDPFRVLVLRAFPAVESAFGQRQAHETK